MAHLRTWTCHEIAIQSGHKAFLVLVRGNRDIFNLHKRIAPDGVHKATMNLLSLFIHAEQQPEQKRPRMS